VKALVVVSDVGGCQARAAREYCVRGMVRLARGLYRGDLRSGGVNAHDHA